MRILHFAFNKRIEGAAAWVGSGALLLALAACSRDSPPAQQASDLPEQPAPVQEQAASPISDREATVQVSQEIQNRCQLPGSPEEVPRFDYDQAELRPRGANILDEVAKCLSGGALQGQTVTLIGRADPRGPADYNRELGVSRAEAARNYLTERGVPADQLRLLSRGEQGATGHDEETWELDRRVDLELGERTEPTSGAASNSPE